MAKAVSRKESSVFIVPFSIGQSLCGGIGISKGIVKECGWSRGGGQALRASSFQMT